MFDNIRCHVEIEVYAILHFLFLVGFWKTLKRLCLLKCGLISKVEVYLILLIWFYVFTLKRFFSNEKFNFALVVSIKITANDVYVPGLVIILR